jgi:hypothetical protein
MSQVRTTPLLLAALLVAPLAAQDTVVHDAAELKAALGSDRTIVLEPGDYVFESALRIDKLRNLTIRGRDRATCRILAKDDYADVVVVADSENVTFESLTMGHHPDVAYCVGGVLAFWRSKDVRALSVTLFGSGVEGLSLVEVDGALAEDVEIRECTSSGMSVASSRDVLVRNSVIHENELWSSIFNVHSSTVVVEDTRVAHAANEPANLVATRHVPYFLTHEDWEPPEDGKGSFTMRRGVVTGAIKVPSTGVPDVVLEDVDTSGAGSNTCGAQDERIAELEAEVARLKVVIEELEESRR